MEQLRPCATTIESIPKSPGAMTAESTRLRHWSPSALAHVLQNQEKPRQWEAHTHDYRVAPCFPQLEESSCSNKDPAQPKKLINQYTKNFKCQQCQRHIGADSKESVCNEGDPGVIPGLGRSPGKGNGNPLQYSSLGNLMDKGAWQATVHGSQRVRHDWATNTRDTLL